MKQGLLITLSCLLLSACIGDLPQEDFPCLIAEDSYNRYNEAYVFSPQGDKEAALRRIQDAELECVAVKKKPRSPT